jgi:hypothetical protein
MPHPKYLHCAERQKDITMLLSLSQVREKERDKHKSGLPSKFPFFNTVYKHFAPENKTLFSKTMTEIYSEEEQKDFSFLLLLTTVREQLKEGRERPSGFVNFTKVDLMYKTFTTGYIREETSKLSNNYDELQDAIFEKLSDIERRTA